MERTSLEPPAGARRAWIAVVLGLLVPGLGQVYAGRWRRGAAIVAVLLLVNVAVSAAIWTPLLAVLVSLGNGVNLFALVDAGRQARRAAAGTRVHGGVYGLYVLAVVAAVLTASNLIRTHWVRAFRMPSTLMQPTLLAGDFLFADMRRGPSRLPRPGDLFLYEESGPKETLMLKRVVAVPGQRVEVRDHRLIVDGASCTSVVPGASVGSERLGSHRYTVVVHPQARHGDWGPLVVPDSSYAVLGDNRPNSADSRFKGFVPADDLHGRARWIYFSVDPHSGRVRWERIGKRLSPD
jgi:signal peptidase I